MQEFKKANLHWQDFDTYCESGHVGGSKIHAFEPHYSFKGWDKQEYVGNRTLCGHFRLYDENEHVIPFDELTESQTPGTLAELANIGKSYCKRCLSIWRSPKPISYKGGKAPAIGIGSDTK